MYYKEFLRARSLFVGFAIAIALLALFVFLVSGVHAQVTVSDGSTPHAAHHISVDNAHHAAASSVLLAIAGFAAAIFATVLGTCLAAENCGHLEVAWTRPASRLAYASRLMLVDVTAVAVMFVFVVLVSLALIYACGWQSYLFIDDSVYATLGRFVAYPLAWFGLVAALTASVRLKAGAIAGFSWLAAGVLIILIAIDLPPAIHGVVAFLNYFNPLLYGSYVEGVNTMNMTPALDTAGLLGIAIAGIAASLVQWRRLEA